MTCTVCKVGATEPGHVTVTLERDGRVVLIKEVPAEVCSNCGEYYLAEDIATELYRRAEEASQQGEELRVLRWAA